MEYFIAIYVLIGLVIATYIYRNSPRDNRAILVGVLVGAVWPLMIVILLFSEERDI